MTTTELQSPDLGQGRKECGGLYMFTGTKPSLNMSTLLPRCSQFISTHVKEQTVSANFI